MHPHLSARGDPAPALSERELHAVLLHEVMHARRRDNLLRLIHELAQCLLWFHPLLWLTGLARLDVPSSPVMRWCQGQQRKFRLGALAKLASPENSLVLRSAATSARRSSARPAASARHS